MRMRIFSRGFILFLTGSRLQAANRARSRSNSTFFAVVDIVLQTPSPAVKRLALPGSSFAERHAKEPQQLTGLVVAAGARDEGHVHALREVHLVRVNLGKHHLFLQSQTVIAVPVEALGIDAAKVADTRQGDADEPIEKLIHSQAAQRYSAANLISLPQTEGADGYLRLGGLHAGH